MSISLTSYFLLPLAAMLAMMFGLWLYYARRERDEEKHPGEGKIYRCEHCRLVYVERRMYPLLECPRCRHSNAAIRR